MKISFSHGRAIKENVKYFTEGFSIVYQEETLNSIIIVHVVFFVRREKKFSDNEFFLAIRTDHKDKYFCWGKKKRTQAIVNFEKLLMMSSKVWPTLRLCQRIHKTEK